MFSIQCRIPEVFLLERASVAALPGTCFGKVGKDYVRFSLLKSEDRLREAVRRVVAVLA